MKKLNFILRILIGLTILSCTPKNEEQIGSVVGTYNLVSIKSDIALDLDLNGDFISTELINEISCTSSMTLNSNGVIEWDYLNISQNFNPQTNTYSDIQCQKVNGGIGQYEISYEGISIVFDSNINVISATLNSNLIKVKREANLVVNIGGQIQLLTVQLIFTYKEQ